MKREIFFSKIMQKMWQGGQFQTSLCFLRKLSEVKSNCSADQFHYISIVFNVANNKNKLMDYQTIDSVIYSILIFQERIQEQFLHHILCMIFQEKCLSFHILLTDQISLSDWPYLLRFQAICVLQLFVCQVMTP